MYLQLLVFPTRKKQIVNNYLTLLLMLFLSACATDSNRENTNVSNNQITKQTVANITVDFKLTETHLGKLPLTKNIPLVDTTLQYYFAAYQLKQGVNEQAIFSNFFYQLTLANKPMATINLQAGNLDKVQSVFILNDTISDVYGVKLGNTFAELKQKRPNLQYQIDKRARMLVSEENSRIKYYITDPINKIENKKYAVEELQNWIITALFWQ